MNQHSWLNKEGGASKDRTSQPLDDHQVVHIQTNFNDYYYKRDFPSYFISLNLPALDSSCSYFPFLQGVYSSNRGMCIERRYVIIIGLIPIWCANIIIKSL